MKQLFFSISVPFFAIGILLCSVGAQDMIAAFYTPIDIYEDYPADYSKVKAVDTELGMLLDIFCEEETVKKQNGAITGRSYDYYYILPVFSSSDEDTYYIALMIDAEDAKPYNELVDATWAYLDYESDYVLAEPIEFKGTLKKMEDELYEYFENWFTEYEYFENDEDMKKHLLPYVLDKTHFGNMKIMAYITIGLFAIGFIMLILAIIPHKKYSEPARAIITINGANYPATNFTKVNVFVEKGKTEKAISQLQKVINIDSGAAAYIISNWTQYWN